MGKTSTQETTQTVDPQMARESHALLNLFRLLGSGGFQPNRGVTVAGFTPKQQAGFDMGDAAASAFGFGAPSGNPMPPTEMSASGIAGYRPSREYDASQAALPQEYQDMMKMFYQNFGQQTPYQQYSPDSGGKK